VLLPVEASRIVIPTNSPPRVLIITPLSLISLSVAC
jgi:hypothetical protein